MRKILFLLLTVTALSTVCNAQEKKDMYKYFFVSYSYNDENGTLVNYNEGITIIGLVNLHTIDSVIVGTRRNINNLVLYSFYQFKSRHELIAFFKRSSNVR